MWLRTTYAGAAGSNGPICFIEQNLWGNTIIICYRPLASLVIVKTPTLAGFFRIKMIWQVPRFKVRTPLLHRSWTVSAGRILRVLCNSSHIHAQIVDECHQCALTMFMGFEWTAGNVDSLVFQIGICFIYALRQWDLGLRPVCRQKQAQVPMAMLIWDLGRISFANIIHGLAANIAILAIQGSGNSPFHHADETIGRIYPPARAPLRPRVRRLP